MEEVKGDSIIFKFYFPFEEEVKRGGTPFDLGNGYRGVGRLDKRREGEGYGRVTAHDSEGKVIFRGGVDYHKGIGALGQTSGSFQRASEHRGKRIGRKMAVVGLEILKRFVESERLPLEMIALKTNPGSSMAKIAEYLGMEDIDGEGFYAMDDFPDVEEKMLEMGISELPVT